MVDHPTCTWTGASRKQYVYDVHNRHPRLPPNQHGNFIYAKMDEHRRWVPVYVGEGNLTQRASVDRHCVECIDAKGAIHVHVHVNAKKQDRLAEQQDLLENFPQAQRPDGCNEPPER